MGGKYDPSNFDFGMIFGPNKLVGVFQDRQISWDFHQATFFQSSFHTPASQFGMLCFQSSVSAHGYKEWLSYQISLVIYLSDLSYQKGVSTNRTTAHWIVSAFHTILHNL